MKKGYSRNIHCYAIGSEVSGGRMILKTTEEIVVANVIEWCIALESVNLTLAFDCIRALNITVIGNEYFCASVKWLFAVFWFLRPVVPPDVNFHVASVVVGYDLIHFCYVRWLRRIGRSHEHAIAGWFEGKNRNWLEKNEFLRKKKRVMRIDWDETNVLWIR